MNSDEETETILQKKLTSEGDDFFRYKVETHLFRELIVKCGPGATELPRGVHVDGDLQLSDVRGLTGLPGGLHVHGDLTLERCPDLEALPDDLVVNGTLHLNTLPRLTVLPPRLTCGRLVVYKAPVTGLPDDTRVVGSGSSYNQVLNLSCLPEFTRLPERLLSRGTVKLVNLPKLTALPRVVRATALELDDLPALTTGATLIDCCGDVTVKNAASLARLADVVRCDELKLENVPALTEVATRVDCDELRLSTARACTRVAACLNTYDLRVNQAPSLTHVADECTPCLSRLSFIGCPVLTRLPGLTNADRLELNGCPLITLPAGLSLGNLTLQDSCTVPEKTRVKNRFLVSGEKVTCLPDDLRLSHECCVSVRDAPLRTLATLQRVRSLDLVNLPNLVRLPDALHVDHDLTLSQLPAFEWPAQVRVSGDVVVEGGVKVRRKPRNVRGKVKRKDKHA